MYSSEDGNSPKYNEVDQVENLQQTVNSMNALLLSLVMSSVRSKFKLLRMSWYISIKLFRANLKLAIYIYLCSSREYFPEFESYSNNLILSEIGK